MKFEAETTGWDDSIEDNKLLMAAEKQAERVLSDPINPDDFADIYGENVEKDKQYVARMEEQFKQIDARKKWEVIQFNRIAKVFEAIIFEQAELSNWLGESATTIQASRFDDIANHVDTIVEFEEGPASASHLALAFDVTSGTGSIDHKMRDIRAEIDKGTLTNIKYFVSEHLSFRGHKSLVPRTIIGADRKTIHEVVEMWVKKDTKKLAEHPIQIKILEQIRIQLEAFKIYAERTGKPTIAAIYEKSLATINDIIISKAPTEEVMRDLYKDEVFEAIVVYSRNFKEGFQK